MERLREGYDTSHDGLLLIGEWLDRDMKRRPVNWFGSAHENAYNWVGHEGIKRIRSRRQIESSFSDCNKLNMGCCYEILPARALNTDDWNWWNVLCDCLVWQCGIWKYYFHFTQLGHLSTAVCHTIIMHLRAPLSTRTAFQLIWLRLLILIWLKFNYA